MKITSEKCHRMFDAFSLQILPGLGRSEFFYSWTITIYSLGEVIMAPIAGYSTRIIPYWYILAVGILMQMFGYIIYAVASEGWMLLVARLLTGGYSGIIETISYSYVSEKEQDYREAYFQVHEQDLSKKNGKLKLPNVKEKMFSLLTIVVAFAYLLGPGKVVRISCSPSNFIRCQGKLQVIFSPSPSPLPPPFNPPSSLSLPHFPPSPSFLSSPSLPTSSFLLPSLPSSFPPSPTSLSPPLLQA